MNVAVPSARVAVPRGVLPSVRVTVPVAGSPGELTVTVAVAAVPYWPAGAEAVIVGLTGVIAGTTSCRVASTLPAVSVE